MTDSIDIVAMQEVYLGDSVKAVMQERVEQITRHGYDASHDDKINAVGQMVSASRAVLALCDQQYATPDLVFAKEWPWKQPHQEPEKWLERMEDKDDYERLVVAAALILAEMDRLDRIAREHDHSVED